MAGYEETRARIGDAHRVGASLNCPRLLRLHDGQLLLVVDYRDLRGDSCQAGPPSIAGFPNLFYRSFDSGETWHRFPDLKTRWRARVPWCRLPRRTARRSAA